MLNSGDRDAGAGDGRDREGRLELDSQADGRSTMQNARVRALCHNRLLPETERIEVVKGTIAERDDVERAMTDVTHVVHLATCKENA